ncbi:MAG TPA: hypothetical protein VNJ29_03810 [Candidatus Nitrosotenuis sp.]|nr:hypothetical protein [Candidatus Nitrosotenuis sp.]
MKKSIPSLLVMTLFFNTAYSFNWPILDNHQDNLTARRNHQIMMNSLFANALEEKPGFKYKGHWFKVRGEIPGGNNYGMSFNHDLFNHANSLKRHFDHGDHIQILPVTSKSVYQDFKERCIYKALINGRDQGLRFRVYNADGEINQLQRLLNASSPTQTLEQNHPSSEVPPRGILRNGPANRPPRHVRFVDGDLHSERDRQALQERQARRSQNTSLSFSDRLSDSSQVRQLPLIHVDNSLVDRWVNRPLGRGAPLEQGSYGYVSPQTFKQLLERHQDHPILKYAFDFIKAADLADYQDPILLANFIDRNDTSVSKEEVIQAINSDIGLIKKAQEIARHKKVSRPFKDQLSYPQYGYAKAIEFIRKYPQLVQGKLPDELKSLKGGKAQALLTAQYYIAAVKAKKSGQISEFKQTLDKIGGLYRHKLPNNAQLNRLLAQTYLVHDGIFFTPAHNYVKHGDVIKTINQYVDQLPHDIQVSQSLENIYTDCSGFACMILRKLFPENDWMQNHRAMSWQFAAAYDLLNGGNKFIQNNSSRVLTTNEKRLLHNNRQTAQKLAEMLTPVTQTRNVRAGDILVARDPQGSYEGHVMIIVDPHPNPRNADEVIVIEMTQAGFAGNRNGLIWRKTNLKNSERHVNRLLRPKIN